MVLSLMLPCANPADVQAALQVVCSDGSIVSFVFNLSQTAAAVTASDIAAAAAPSDDHAAATAGIRDKQPLPALRATAAGYGDLLRVYIDTETPDGVRARCKHFPLISGGAVHCSTTLLLLGSEGARVFAAAHAARDKAKRSYFPDPGSSASSSASSASASATGGGTDAAGAMSGGAKDSCWAAVDAPDRAPHHMSVNAAQTLACVAYRQRVALLELGIGGGLLSSSSASSAGNAGGSGNASSPPPLRLQLGVCASIEVEPEWSVEHAAWLSTYEQITAADSSSSSSSSAASTDGAVCMVQQRAMPMDALPPSVRTALVASMPANGNVSNGSSANANGNLQNGSSSSSSFCAPFECVVRVLPRATRTFKAHASLAASVASPSVAGPSYSATAAGSDATSFASLWWSTVAHDSCGRADATAPAALALPKPTLSAKLVGNGGGNGEVDEWQFRFVCAARVCAVATHTFDRHESSASLSSSAASLGGALVAIGCIDGTVYLLRVNCLVRAPAAAVPIPASGAASGASASVLSSPSSAVVITRVARLAFRAHSFAFHRDGGVVAALRHGRRMRSMISTKILRIFRKSS
jgi:hypothetical protein